MTWRRGGQVLALLCVVAACPRVVPADDEPASAPLWRACYDAIDWHVAAEVPNTESKLMELVGQRKLVAFSQTWVRKAIQDHGGLTSALARAAKEKKLVLWYVPHIEGQHMILPHLLDRYMMVGPLSHPDVTDLVHESFVAVKLPAGGALGKQYDLVAPAAIEPALLVLRPDGEVVRRMDRISVFEPAYVRQFLVAALGRDPLRRLYESDVSTAVLRRRVIAARWHGSARAPLVSDVARYLETDAPVRLAWATFLLGQGRAEEALPLLARDGGIEDAERGYHLGVAQYLLKRDDEARGTWAAVAKKHPTSIWGAKADAYARDGTDKAHGEGPLTRGMVHLQGHHRVTPPDDKAWIADVRARGLAFLLQQQRADGSWEGARWGGGKEDEKEGVGQRGYSNIKIAITALCANALRGAPTNARARDALARAEKLLLRDGLVERGEAIVWTYADAFRLLHFARRLRHLPAERQKRVRRKMEVWIRHLVEHQNTNEGCFRHYVYRSTFVTACVTYCLVMARRAGLDVPASVFEAAAKALEAARGGEHGLYGYLLDHPAVTRSLKGASGRQPLCEWTLSLVGRRTPDDLHKALEIFHEGYVHLEQARKVNFHVPSLDSTAGYYFFHDFYPACEAARASGPHAADHTKRLLAKLRALQEPDGTFLDCGFSYGKCYSTAMALLSLEALTR